MILQYRLKTVETDCWDYVKGDLHDCLVEVKFTVFKGKKFWDFDITDCLIYV